jgi:hypothetical protein
MAYIGTIKGTNDVEYPIASTLYGICETPANEEIKRVRILNTLENND